MEPAIHGYLSINAQGGFSLNEKSDAPMAVKVALESLKPLGEETPKAATTLDRNEVAIVCRDEDKGIWVQAKVKVAEVAKLIGLDDNETKNSIEQGNLFQDIATAISKQYASEIEITSDITTSAIMPADHLTTYGLTADEYVHLTHVYDQNKDRLESKKLPGAIFVGRNTVTPAIPRSYVYVPEGVRKGFYVILKSHGGIQEKGVGSFNTATLCLCLDTGKGAIFRTGPEEHVSDDEAEIMALVSGHPENFVGGDYVGYEGPLRARGAKDKAARKATEPRQEDVLKGAFIMDWMAGGDLFHRLNRDPPSTDKEKLAIALKIAQSLWVLQEDLNIAHLDLKTENILLTNEGKARLGDFGHAATLGAKIHPSGTVGYMAPEVVQAQLLSKSYEAASPADIWGFGCILTILFYGSDWVNHFGKSINTKEGFQKYQSDPDLYDSEMKSKFTEWDKPGHIDHVIYHCLRWEPGERCKAEKATGFLEDIADALSDDEDVSDSEEIADNEDISDNL